MRHITLIFISMTVALIAIATMPFCLTEKRIQRKLASHSGKKINYV